MPSLQLSIVVTNTRSIIRRISVPKEVINVQINGDDYTTATVAITMKNGKTLLYKATGQIIR